MPGDVELCIRVSFLVFCDCKFKAALSNIAPRADLMSDLVITGTITVSETISILICLDI
jgi:hypothetical protein